jgi:hypothetical protein
MQVRRLSVVAPLQRVQQALRIYLELLTLFAWPLRRNSSEAAMRRCGGPFTPDAVNRLISVSARTLRLSDSRSHAAPRVRLRAHQRRRGALRTGSAIGRSRTRRATRN